jgi:hypothetical protein
MNDSTSTKKSSKTSKSDRAESAPKRIKALPEDRVEAQLARRSASGETENAINYDGTSLETTAVEALPSKPLSSCLHKRLSLPKSLMNLPRGLTAG